MKEQLKKLGVDFAKNELRKKWDELDGENAGLLNDILAKAAENGIFSFVVGEELGGSGFGPAEYCVFIKEVSKACAGVGVLFVAHLMGITPILMSRVKDKRSGLLSVIAEAENKSQPALFSFAACEDNRACPELGDITTTLSSDGDKLILSGAKTNVIGAQAASFITTLAKGEDDSFSWVVVGTDMTGVEIKKQRQRLGIKICPVNNVEFNNVEISEDNVLSESDNLVSLYSCYEYFDAPLGAAAFGMAHEAYSIALKYSTERHQGGKIICDLDAVRMLLAEMALTIEASEALAACGSGIMRSAYATTIVEQVCLDAIQVLGGYGYMKDYKVERILRDGKNLQLLINPHAKKMAHIRREIEKAR